MSDTTDHLYLGRTVTDENKLTDEPLNYPLDHLTTHALLLGATGSGKTGLGLVLVEEALREGVSVLLLDVKGDLANLLLTFPELNAASFEPWVDVDAAARNGLSATDAAGRTAAQWREGLAAWALGPEDIEALRERADLRLYTPGLRSGRPLDILARFAAPPTADPDEAALRAQGLASALLGLAGIEADPLHSREHILLTTLIRHSWQAGSAMEIPRLIMEVQQPPMDQVGVFDLESFFPEKDRFKLALTLNNLIAAPGFARWRSGTPLDIDRYLTSVGGRPQATVFYLAHLPEDQRRFFLTLFLEELRTWIRSQGGTRSLRALLFFDEVYGYLPPYPHNPPTKAPLMALVKQGRAAGLGVVLSTQNPADLDYKGLGNIGSWFVGTLRTDRDKHRVLEGMEGSIATTGLRRSEVDEALTRLRPRVFLMHDANAGKLAFFRSRWAMSYLRGPLTTAEVQRLAADAEDGAGTTSSGSSASPMAAAAAAPTAPILPTAARTTATSTPPVGRADALSSNPPSVDPGIPQAFLPPTITAAWAARHADLTLAGEESPRLVYHPYILGVGTARIFDDRANISLTDEQVWRIPPSKEDWELRWDQGEMVNLALEDLSRTPLGEGGYTSLPSPMARKSAYPKWESALKTQIYHHSEIMIWSCPRLRLYSRPNETKGAFLARCSRTMEERVEAELSERRRVFENRATRLEAKIRREEMELDNDEDQLRELRREELLSGAESVARIFSRRRRSYRPLSRLSRQRRYVNDAKADVEESEEMLRIYEQQMDDLEEEWQAAARAIQDKWSTVLDDIRESTVRAKRRDIAIRFCGLAWFPFWEPASGELLPAYVPA